ncbi:MAG: tRNA (adenosine(37)-N6)-dimethylallyltransferase MiaA [Synergistaceae bacterium]|nr:tRNA (adenosine(37)-N6)-dimethylallyltransferase MiaA [Synergistaceae bacterium]
MYKNKQRVVAIVGATATGKTALSLEIAEKLRAEIISVDSRQVYRYMDVGTDKVSFDIRRKIIHHLIDVADPDENFTVTRFVELCKDCVARITSRGRVPLFVGGTAFYYQSLFNPVITDGIPHDAHVRSRLETFAKEEGNQALYLRLQEIDPLTAKRLHYNDTRRVSRMLEIFEITGKAPSEIFSENDKILSPFDVLYIGLDRPRPEIYGSITERVKWQFNNGYPEEVEWLLKNGYDEKYPSMQGFGYRELVEYIKGNMSFEDALEGDVKSTKAFCRRQMTWFTKFSPIVWYDSEVFYNKKKKNDLIDLCIKYIEVQNENYAG